MKLILTLISILSIQIIIGQNTFKEGYFIDNTGKKTSCLIKNTGWRSNPTEFKWKSSEDGEAKITTIKNIKEFGINDILKYVRYTVAFDLSPIRVQDLESSRNVNKKTATLFLNTLINHPKASLYMYQKGDVKKFFYKTENSETPELLVYKKHLITNKQGIDKIGENLMYQFQLQQIFPIEGKKVTSISYQKNELKKYIESYLESKNSTATFIPKSTEFKTEIGVLGGLSFTSFNIEVDNFGITKYEFEDKIAPRFGVYVESYLPFYNNKFSLFLEASHLNFTSKNTDLEKNSLAGKELIYKSIDLTAGVRFYFFLNPSATSHKIKLYLESGITLPLNKKTRLEPFISRNIDTTPSTSIPLGIGLKYNRFGISYRHYSAIDLLNLNIYKTRRSDLKIGTLALSVVIF